MSERKTYQIIAFVVLMILFNYIGKTIADYYSLPIWMDSLGTVITAYVCDPFCGAIVGLALNIAYGFQDPQSLLYGLTSIAIGVSAGICARKKWLESLFGILTSSVIITVCSVTISAPINMFMHGGMVGNQWGDGVVMYLLERGLHPFAATIVGEFYVDFLDKVITLVLLFALIHLHRAQT